MDSAPYFLVSHWHMTFSYKVDNIIQTPANLRYRAQDLLFAEHTASPALAARSHILPRGPHGAGVASQPASPRGNGCAEWLHVAWWVLEQQGHQGAAFRTGVVLAWDIAQERHPVFDMQSKASSQLQPSTCPHLIK